MEGILNLLRKLGYSENEIKTVLEKVPVEQQGIMGTNVATGIFSKPKEGKLAKDFLISDKIGNPFEINYYKGRSRDDILKSAEAQLKMIDDEFTKVTDQILNKNLQLTQEQRINFARNLEAKRRFEKDFEAFKTRPEAEVLDITTKEKVGDVEALKEKAGLVAPPTTDLGRIDLRNKQIMQSLEDIFKSDVNLEKEEAARKALLAKQYEGKGYAGGTFGPSGTYRAVARDFLLDQNAKGKIKLTPDTVKSLEEGSYISGGQPLMYADPIRIMRFHYGDDVFDKIPLEQLNKSSGAKSDVLEAMSKIKASPVKAEAPMTPGGYMTPGEMKANIEELEDIEKMIQRRESRFADMTEEEIQNELEQYGAKKASFEMAFQFDHPEAYEEFIKSRPDKKAEGGAMGLDYLTGMEPPKEGYATGGRVNFQKGGAPKMLEHLINKLVEEKKFNRTLLEKSSPKAIQDLYIEKYGALPSAQEIKEIVNKQLQGKYSMETVNPKTGEITSPKEPVTTAERKIIDYDAMDEANKLSLKHKEAAYAFDEIQPIDIYDKIAPDRVAEVMAEIKGKDYYDLSQKQQSELYKKAQSFLDDYKKIDRINTAVKKFNAGQELQAMDKKYLSQFLPESGVTFESKVDKPIERGFDFNDPEIKAQMEKAMQEAPVIKNRALDSFLKVLNTDRLELERIQQKYTGVIDDSFLEAILLDPNPQTRAEIMAQIDEALVMQQKGMSGEEIINVLDKTKRTKQAQGGRIGYAEGSDGAPSITLDSHDKAPDNMDKYPIKAGNLELGISGLITGGKNYQSDPYTKLSGSERNISVRGKYNVPNTGVSLLGDIGDVRIKSGRDVNVPQYSYKESIRDIMKANPYSVGIEYAPNQNKNINLRYDDQGNVMLRGEYKFSKGGLGYLVGE